MYTQSQLLAQKKPLHTHKTTTQEKRDGEEREDHCDRSALTVVRLMSAEISIHAFISCRQKPETKDARELLMAVLRGTSPNLP